RARVRLPLGLAGLAPLDGVDARAADVVGAQRQRRAVDVRAGLTRALLARDRVAHVRGLRVLLADVLDVEGDLHDLGLLAGVDAASAAADGKACHVEGAVGPEARADHLAALRSRRAAGGLVVRQPVLHAQHLARGAVLAHRDFLPEAVVRAAVVDEP